MNETTHDEQNVSKTEDDTSEEESATQMQIYENNGEQNKPEEKLLATNLKLKVKAKKLKGS